MIPVAKPFFKGNEKKYLAECIDTAWVSSAGPFVKKFEDHLSSFHDLPYATTTSSGTAALEIAAYALGLKSGDEILMPNFTMFACANAVARLGIRPRFVDADPLSFNMNFEEIEKKITSRTKALMVVHLYGRPEDMERAVSLCKKFNLKLIEDCAEALGARYSDQIVGSFGDVATLSFFANKQVTSGEGGAVLTKSEEIYKRASQYKNLFLGKGADRFNHEEFGANYRMSNLQAAVGLAQFENLQNVLDRKREIWKRYDERLDPKLYSRPNENKKYTLSPWMFALKLNPELGLTAKEAAERLRDLGVETRLLFKGMHQQPACREFIQENEFFPVSENLHQFGLYLPSGPDLSLEEQDEVINKFHEVLS